MEEIQVVLYGKRVNVSKWADYHPGGKEIMKSFHNRDATEQFEAMHSPAAKNQLVTGFLPKAPCAKDAFSSARTTVTFAAASSSVWESGSSIPDSNTQYDPTKENPIGKDFQQLRKTLVEKGLFKANVAKEFLVTFYTVAMFFVGGYLIFFTPYANQGLFLLFLGLFQSGWVSHSYLHHSVFESVYWNEVVGDIIGTLQGYDGNWWKLRHNAHHVNTNECLHDPDTSIAPLFHFVQQYPDLKTRLKHIQKYQHYYFLPALAFLDVDWRLESILYAKKAYLVGKDKLPAIKLMVHYAFAAAIINVVGLWPAILVVLARGFCTAIIVFSSHYTEKRFNSAPTLSFVEQTTHSTRNIGGGFLMDFFSGHISLQIEHHLFPTMPPHNLIKARPYVKQFCKEHSLPYNESSLLECTARLLNSLNMHA